MLPDPSAGNLPVRLITKLFIGILPWLAIIASFLGHLYIVLLLGLPLYYVARASSDASLSTSTSAPEGLLSSLLMDWKMLSVASALIIPSVHISYFLNRYKTISPTHPNLSTILGIFQLPGAFALDDVRAVGFISLACAFISMVFSCLLIISLGSSRAGLHSFEGNARVWRMVSID
jgi:hypothetical protein